jgi:predicted outer membrane repeat protein
MKLRQVYVAIAIMLLLSVVMGVSAQTPTTLNVATDGTVGAGAACPSPRDSATYASIQAAIDCAQGFDEISIAAGTYTETLTINKTLTLVGATAETTIIDADDTGRVLTVTGAVTVSLRNIGLHNGAADTGAGLRTDDSTIILRETAFVGNDATGDGGAVYTNAASVTFEDSILRDNTAGGNGGAIFTKAGTVSLARIIVDNNSATVNGGGIYSQVGTVEAENLMLSDNMAASGGGLYVEAAAVDLLHATVAGNDNVGVVNADGVVTLTASIIGSGTVQDQGQASIDPFALDEPANTGGDCSGEFVSQGYNLLGSDTGCTLTGDSALLATDQLNVNPLLILPADDAAIDLGYGLSAGSPAVDNVPSAVCAVSSDLYGIVRPQGSACDSGAVELTGDLARLTLQNLTVVPDNVADALIDLSVTIRNDDTIDSAPFSVQVYLSDDDVCEADADAPLLPTPEALDALTVGTETLLELDDIELPKPILYENALNEDPSGQGAGTVSVHRDYVCVLISSGADLTSTAFDDVTYFPWDVVPDDQILPDDALAVINALGTANENADFDGNGVVSPSEAINLLLRLGYTLNTNVCEGGVCDAPAKLEAPTQALPTGERGERTAQANVQLTITELDTEPGIRVGEQFNVNIIMRDAANTALFSGFVDLQFDPLLLRADGVRYGEQYSMMQLGNIDNENGVIRDLGGVSGNFTAQGDGLVAIVRMTAIREGLTLFATRPATASVAQVVSYGGGQDVRNSLQPAMLNIGIQPPVAPSAPLPVAPERGNAGEQPGSVNPVNPQPTPTPLPPLPVGSGR